MCWFRWFVTGVWEPRKKNTLDSEVLILIIMNTTNNVEEALRKLTVCVCVCEFVAGKTLFCPQRYIDKNTGNIEHRIASLLDDLES